MTTIFVAYINQFLRPFKFHRFLYLKRHHEDAPINEGEGLLELSFAEALGFSWILKIIYCIYSIVMVHLGLYIVTVYNSKDQFIFPQDYFLDHRFQIFINLFEVVLFPLLIWIYLKIWEVLIKFFANLYGIIDDIEQASKQIVKASLSSYLFLFFPIIGDFLAGLAQLFLIFAGLKENLKMNNTQSILVIISPIIIIMITILVLILYFFLLIKMF